MMILRQYDTAARYDDLPTSLTPAQLETVENDTRITELLALKAVVEDPEDIRQVEITLAATRQKLRKQYLDHARITATCAQQSAVFDTEAAASAAERACDNGEGVEDGCLEEQETVGGSTAREVEAEIARLVAPDASLHALLFAHDNKSSSAADIVNALLLPRSKHESEFLYPNVACCSCRF